MGRPPFQGFYDRGTGWSVSTGRKGTHGPTSSRYCFAITRAACATCPRSCATHAASSCRSVTRPKLGCSPGRSSSRPVSFHERSSATFAARKRANSSSRDTRERPGLRVRWRKRSYGANWRSGPRARMIRARGIQSVSSPSIRCPTTSNGLNVSGPSVPRTHGSPRASSSARSVAGERRSSSIDRSRSNSMIVMVASSPHTLTDETQAVAVGVLHIHLAVAPRLVGRLKIDPDMLADQVFVQRIDVVHQQVHDATGNPVTREGRDVQPGIVACQPDVAGVRFGRVNAIREVPAEAEPVAIGVLRRRRTTYMEDGDRQLEQMTPPLVMDSDTPPTPPATHR